MPIFGRNNDDEPAPVSTADASVDDGDDVEIGGAEAIGAAGRARIDAHRDGLASGDMTLNNLIWTEKIGYQPLGVVLGNSVFHIGMTTRSWGRNEEVAKLTQVMHDARESAIARLVAEAEQLGADGVLQVTLKIDRWNWAPEFVDVTAWGTAVRSVRDDAPGRTPGGAPFTTSFNAAAVWRMVSAGYAPLGYVFGTCVYHVAHQKVGATLRRIGRNVEMTNYTQAMYDARELAMARAEAEARSLGAAVVPDIATAVTFRGWGEHVMEFTAYGNALAATGRKQADPDPSLTYSV